MSRLVAQPDRSAPDVSRAEVADDDHAVEVLDDDHRALVLQGLEQSRRGEIANDEEVDAVLSRLRR